MVKSAYILCFLCFDILVLYRLFHSLGSQKMTGNLLIDETFFLHNKSFARAIKHSNGWVCASADRIASECLRQTKKHAKHIVKCASLHDECCTSKVIPRATRQCF